MSYFWLCSRKQSIHGSVEQKKLSVVRLKNGCTKVGLQTFEIKYAWLEKDRKGDYGWNSPYLFSDKDREWSVACIHDVGRTCAYLFSCRSQR